MKFNFFTRRYTCLTWVEPPTNMQDLCIIWVIPWINGMWGKIFKLWYYWLSQKPVSQLSNLDKYIQGCPASFNDIYFLKKDFNLPTLQVPSVKLIPTSYEVSCKNVTQAMFIRLSPTWQQYITLLTDPTPQY